MNTNIFPDSDGLMKNICGVTEHLRVRGIETLEVRDNDDIATIMDVIDWDDAFFYDGKFHLYKTDKVQLENLTDSDFFRKIDKTLNHFSYICYLKKEKVIKNNDMRSFEYALTRIFQNEHMLVFFLFLLSIYPNIYYRTLTLYEVNGYALQKICSE